MMEIKASLRKKTVVIALPRNPENQKLEEIQAKT
jgi:hypothetical protein